MDIAGLVLGTIPAAIQLCQYLKKVNDHADDRDKLIQNFELYIDYAKQVEEKLKTGNISNQASQHVRQHNHDKVFKRLKDILEDPALQSFMEKAFAAEGNKNGPILASSVGNQSSNLISFTDPPAQPHSVSKKTKSLFGRKKKSANPTSSTTPTPGSESGGLHSVQESSNILDWKPWSTKGKGKSKQNEGFLSPANTSHVFSQSFTHQRQSSATNLKTVDPWLWPFKESNFIELLQLLKDICDILHKLLHLELLNMTEKIGMRLHDAQSDEKKRIALEWLSPLTFAQVQDEAFNCLQKGTGEWLLKDATFQGWLCGEKRALLCHGLAGAGKTTLSIDELNRSTSQGKGSALAFLYYKYNSQDIQTLTDMIGSILRQLEDCCSIDPDITDVHEPYKKQGRKLPLNEKIARLKLCIAAFDTVYVVIDGLDECSHRVEFLNIHVLDFLNSLPNVRIFATSRPLDDVREFYTLNGYSQLDIRARDDDIKLYLNSQIAVLSLCRANLAKFLEADLEWKKEIINAICQRSDGMFLLARLYLELLKDAPTRATVKDAVKKLPKGLDTTYICTIQRIKERNEGQDWKLARRAFMWILYATEPLHLRSFVEALATHDDTGFDVDNVLELGHLVTLSGGLIMLRNPLKPLEFIHYTTQEFFTQHPSILFDVTDGQSVEDETEYTTRAQAELTTTCLAYFRSLFPTQGSCPVSAEECRQNFPFLEYAVVNWGTHARQSALTTILKKMVFDLFDNFCEVTPTPTPGEVDSCTTENPVEVSLVRRHRVPKVEVADLVIEAYKYGSALAVAASFGISKLLLAYFAERKDKCRELSQGTRLLICTAAAWHRAADLLCWMLETYPGENLNHHGLREAVPFWMACAAHNGQESSTGMQDLVVSRKGREVVIKLLLERVEVDVNKPGIHGWTPLNTAVYNNHSDVVKLLLERADVDVNHPAIDGWTPLFTASSNGHTNVVKLLLERADVDVNHPDNDGRTPLYTASSEGHANIVKLLLERADVDVNEPDKYGRTPLFIAYCKGHVNMVKLLLERADVDVNKPGNGGWMPLYTASSKGDTNMVKLLLERADVDVNKPDHGGWTPLYTASRKGHTNVVKLLLERADVDVNHPDNDGWTPLFAALHEGRTNIVKLLLERADVDVNKLDKWGETPLYTASREGHTKIVKLLLERADVDVTKADKFGRTPLDGVTEERRRLESHNLPGNEYNEIEVLLRSRLGLPKAED